MHPFSTSPKSNSVTYPEIVLFGIFLSLYATLKTDILNLPTNFILLLRTRVHAWNQTRRHAAIDIRRIHRACTLAVRLLVLHSNVRVIAITTFESEMFFQKTLFFISQRFLNILSHKYLLFWKKLVPLSKVLLLPSCTFECTNNTKVPIVRLRLQKFRLIERIEK